MPSLKRTPYQGANFLEVCSQSAPLNEKRDCTVKAVAIVCDVTYEEAHAALQAAGRHCRKGCRPSVTKKAIKALGFKVVNVNPRSIIKQYPGAHGKVLKHVTTHHPRRFHKVWEQYLDQNLIIITRDHALAVKCAMTEDWSINNKLYARSIWRIVKADS